MLLFRGVSHQGASIVNGITSLIKDGFVLPKHSPSGFLPTIGDTLQVANLEAESSPRQTTQPVGTLNMNRLSSRTVTNRLLFLKMTQPWVFYYSNTN